jgi:hypothetical protein
MGAQVDAARASIARALASLRGHAVGVDQAEGDVLPDAEAVEQRRALEQDADALEQLAPAPPPMPTRFSPSTSTWPASGRTRPMATLMVTDLPWPDPPMITSDRPPRR